MKGNDKMRELKFITHIYNSGYMAGHDDTVEGKFVPIYTKDMETYHDEEVLELVLETINLPNKQKITELIEYLNLGFPIDQEIAEILQKIIYLSPSK